MKLNRLFATIAAVAFLTACGAPTAEELAGTDVAEVESGLATLEINYGVEPGFLEQQSNACGSLNWLGVWTFEGEGDKLWLKDAEADGKSVGIHWRLADGSRRGLCINKAGNGELRKCDKNFVEGKTIEIRFGRCNDSNLNCEQLGNWTDWSGWTSCRT